jgi:hypothetical protein
LAAITAAAVVVARSRGGGGGGGGSGAEDVVYGVRLMYRTNGGCMRYMRCRGAGRMRGCRGELGEWEEMGVVDGEKRR